MEELFKFLLWIHILSGSTGLITGTLAVVVVKGRRMHKVSGKIFFYSMLLTAVSSLIISNLPGHHNPFLFAIGGFTLYMICSGYRIVWLKRAVKTRNAFSVIDYSITLFALLFGLLLLVQSGSLFSNKGFFGVVPAVFGLICLSYAALDLKVFKGKESIKQLWIVVHITKMVGALIASYTAVLVVNVNMQPEWILWILPSVSGSIVISYNIRKYKPGRKTRKYKLAEQPAVP